MKRNVFFFFLLLALCGTAVVVSAAPGYHEQLALIADHADVWKQDDEFVPLWGYIVTDLDQNGRLEIISASLQGTGMYTYMNVFEVSEDGNSLNEVVQDRPEYDSAPDVMTDKVKGYYEEQADRYYYIFIDMIRNGYAEYYENKRAVYLEDGIWKEIPLAYKTVLYSDPDHFTETFEDAERSTISEEDYDNADGLHFADIKPAEVCLNWQMTERDDFNALDRDSLLASLDASASPVCPEE